MTKQTNPIKKLWRALPFSGETTPLVSVLPLFGAISTQSGRTGESLSYAKLEKAIKAAFKPKSLSAVALVINSPGGSPVQSRLIMQAIRREAAEREVPVIAFVEDIGASGGYILALAGDEIYADESSIVGSIGVINAGFGFQDFIERHGIEWRVHTAGKNKSMLDPFREQTEEEIARLRELLDGLHKQFIDLVTERRNNVASDNDDVFSGRVWLAQEAASLGLIDGIGHVEPFMKKRFGKEVEFKKISVDGGSLLRKLLAKGAPIGTGASLSLIDPDEAISAAERRAQWGRFGL